MREFGVGRPVAVPSVMNTLCEVDKIKSRLGGAEANNTGRLRLFPFAAKAPHKPVSATGHREKWKPSCKQRPRRALITPPSTVAPSSTAARETK